MDIMKRIEKQADLLKYLNEVDCLLEEHYEASFAISDTNISMMENYMQAKRPPMDYTEWYRGRHLTHLKPLHPLSSP